jgi:hypothetical protein
MTGITFTLPKTPEWRCILNGDGNENSVIYYLPGGATPPNIFHRIMLRILLGWKWERMQTKVQECPEPAESLQNVPAASMYTTDSGDVRPRPETDDFSDH